MDRSVVETFQALDVTDSSQKERAARGGGHSVRQKCASLARRSRQRWRASHREAHSDLQIRVSLLPSAIKYDSYIQS